MGRIGLWVICGKLLCMSRFPVAIFLGIGIADAIGAIMSWSRGQTGAALGAIAGWFVLGGILWLITRRPVQR